MEFSSCCEILKFLSYDSLRIVEWGLDLCVSMGKKHREEGGRCGKYFGAQLYGLYRTPKRGFLAWFGNVGA